MQDYFQALNNYYDKVYVLSVESAVARRELFAERFRGLNYSFYFGADKNKFSVEELEEKNIFSEELTRLHHRFDKTMRPGEIACSWSHRMMYEEMIGNNYRYILVFEDDAVPDPKRLPSIQVILDEIPPDCELLLWGWDKNDRDTIGSRFKKAIYHLQHSLGRLKWDHRVIRNLYAKPFSRHLKKAGFHDYTYAYAVSRSGAEKLIALQTPIQYIADNLLAHAATKELVKGYIVWPKVFLHDILPDGTHRDSYIR
ncbi:MAG TPA: glycosyltransferase family 25 protein [Chitinophagaceae bacterium]|jgi:glycosyl transferase family 25|nr:glycosyltransferase family 25 protein [Chitinophagaceae bacterium]